MEQHGPATGRQRGQCLQQGTVVLQEIELLAGGGRPEVREREQWAEMHYFSAKRTILAILRSSNLNIHYIFQYIMCLARYSL